MIGTLVNSAAVVIGSLLGLTVRSKLPEKVTERVFQGIGLFTVFLGLKMAFRTENYLLMIFSMVLGAIAGELLDIDRLVGRFGEWLKKRVKSKNDRFSDGLVTAFLLFCMGSMTILGAFEEGLGGKPDLLLAKSVLDGFSSIALSASLGVGVIFSVIPLLIYQGGLTLFAASLQGILTEGVINELTSVGGLLLIGLGINILGIKKLRILNMIPALLIVIVLAYLFL